MLKREREIPTPEQCIAEQPLSLAGLKIKQERDRQIRDVLSGKSERLLVIVGPCSAHDGAATVEFVSRLGKINQKLEGKLVIVPRIYTNKPRTKGVGYKGMFLQPDPLGEVDVPLGIRKVRALLLAALDASGLTAADEMLYPESAAYVQDLLSYHTVGARSVENPLHRQVASGLDSPVGMKNPMSGNLEALLYSVSAAQNAQEFPYRGWQVKTDGNPYAHAILRGYVSCEGRDVSNFGKEDLEGFAEEYLASGLKNPAVIVDCSHSNSAKQYRRQAAVAESVMESREESEALKGIVKGVMIESFLTEGRQDGTQTFGCSITDPCLGWEDTERLLYRLAELA